jgi:hypothetical protein
MLGAQRPNRGGARADCRGDRTIRPPVRLIEAREAGRSRASQKASRAFHVVPTVAKAEMPERGGHTNGLPAETVEVRDDVIARGEAHRNEPIATFHALGSRGERSTANL